MVNTVEALFQKLKMGTKEVLTLKFNVNSPSHFIFG